MACRPGRGPAFRWCGSWRWRCSPRWSWCSGSSWPWPPPRGRAGRCSPRDSTAPTPLALDGRPRFPRAHGDRPPAPGRFAGPHGAGAPGHRPLPADEPATGPAAVSDLCASWAGPERSSWRLVATRPLRQAAVSFVRDGPGRLDVRGPDRPESVAGGRPRPDPATDGAEPGAGTPGRAAEGPARLAALKLADGRRGLPDLAVSDARLAHARGLDPPDDGDPRTPRDRSRARRRAPGHGDGRPGVRPARNVPLSAGAAGAPAGVR